MKWIMFSLLNYDFLKGLQGYSHIDFNIAHLDLKETHAHIIV
jgi:hypothetical protein